VIRNIINPRYFVCFVQVIEVRELTSRPKCCWFEVLRTFRLTVSKAVQNHACAVKSDILCSCFAPTVNTSNEPL